MIINENHLQETNISRVLEKGFSDAPFRIITIQCLKGGNLNTVSKQGSTIYLRQESDSGGLDLCFDLPTIEIKAPKLKFHFKCPDLELSVQNYMIANRITI